MRARRLLAAYFRLEEPFTGFERTLGLTLPKTWSVRDEASGRTTIEWKYELAVQSVEPKWAARERVEG